MMRDRSPLTEPPRERIVKWVVAIVLIAIAFVPWVAFFPSAQAQAIELPVVR